MCFFFGNLDLNFQYAAFKNAFSGHTKFITNYFILLYFVAVHFTTKYKLKFYINAEYEGTADNNFCNLTYLFRKKSKFMK